MNAEDLARNRLVVAVGESVAYARPSDHPTAVTLTAAPRGQPPDLAPLVPGETITVEAVQAIRAGDSVSPDSAGRIGLRGDVPSIGTALHDADPGAPVSVRLT